jgi:MoaA/NifB/PqqE/SkfB family radical SAM enzyme
MNGSGPSSPNGKKRAKVGLALGTYYALRRRAVDEILKSLSAGDQSKIVRALALAEKVTPNGRKGGTRLAGFEDHPGLLMGQAVAAAVARVNPRCKERFIECGIVNNLVRGNSRRRELSDKEGLEAPSVILMSPTMRCNLSCEGCYAAEYSPDQDLEPEVMQRIVDEGNDMGVYLFTMLGGEPFVYRGLVDFAEANSESYFQIFTNGTAMSGRTIERIAEVGNIAVMLSVEGTPEITDARRGEGIHARVMETMDALAEAGIPFGYSATVTRKNWRVLIDPEFVDPLVAKGAIIGWHFLYMPIGRNPDVSLMPTPSEREEFRLGLLRLRSGRAFFPVDFWGDAPAVGGCIAGKRYMHVTSEGWVEPCIFTHFATDNIHDTSLLDAFNSPFFRAIRARQPYNQNLLRPCMWLDNPTYSREILNVSGARPTHDGGDVMLTHLGEHLDAYSAEAGRILDEAWSEMCGAARWYPEGGSTKAREVLVDGGPR